MKFGTTPETKEAEEAKLVEARRNDNSNPQQGTGSINKMSNPQQGTGGIASKMAPPVTNQDNSAKAMNAKAPSKTPPTKKDSRKLFVGGLPADVTDDEFRDFFAQYGVVMDSVVMYDRETHRSRGFGFVTFEDPEVAASLLKSGKSSDEKTTSATEQPRVGRLVMRGKTCEVKAAEPKETRPSRRPFVPGVGVPGASNTRYVDSHVRRPFKMFGHDESAAPIAAMAGGPPSSMGYPFPLMAQEMNGIVPVMAPSFYQPVPGFNTGNMGHMYNVMPPPMSHGEAPAVYPTGVAAPLMGTHIDGPGVYMDAPQGEVHPPPHPPNYWCTQMPHPPLPIPPPQLAPYPQNQQQPMYINNHMPSSGSAGPSVMQPSMPGIPANEDKNDDRKKSSPA